MAYVGHSQGNQQLYALMSREAKYNTIVRPHIALAPVTYGQFAKQPMLEMLGKSPALQKLLIAEPGSFLDFQHLKLWKLVTSFCAPKMNSHFCALAFWMMIGYNGANMDYERLNVYLAQSPAGVSTWILAHNSQFGSEIREFDYMDDQVNKKMYNSVKPPIYDFSKITNPNMALFWSKGDILAAPGDIDNFRKVTKASKLIVLLAKL